MDLIIEIKNLIKAKVSEVFPEAEIQLAEVELSYPEERSLGDISSNIALKLAKKVGISPRDIATKLQVALTTEPQAFAKVEIAGPGFINMYLTPATYAKIAVDLLERQGSLAQSQIGAGKHYVVEYSSPNIAKPFSVGHLRSTIIGDAVANLLESQGYKIYRDNHLGDWGAQFGKLTYAIQQWSSIEELDKSENVIDDLLKLYVKYHELESTDEVVKLGGPANFKKLEQGDPEILMLWHKCIDWSFEYFDKIYKKLNVKPFTENGGKGYGESFFEDKMATILAELTEKLPENYKFNDGAWLVFFEKATKLPPLMIIKSDGASLYSTRDLATDKFRLQQYPVGTKIINEIGMDQNLYMRQLYETERMLGWYKVGERIHVKHGMYRLPEGKMSTRKGTVILVEDVIDESISRAKQIAIESGAGADIDHVAAVVGIGAVKFNDLKRTPELDIVFDWDEALALKGFSGPYIQYMYARCASILAKANLESLNTAQVMDGALSANLSEVEQEIILFLQRFGDIVSKAAHQYAPYLLCNYLYDLAQMFSKFYASSPVLTAAEPARSLRLAITKTTASVIKEGLELLGIETLEQM